MSVERARASTVRAATASLITGCWSTQVIHAAVALGIPDRFGSGAMSAADIAHAAGAHPRATFRLLRALAALGLCTDLGGGQFELTEAGRFLRSDSPNSLAALARHWGTRTWAALAHLGETVRSGAAWAHGGREGFLSMAQRPEEAAVLNRSMVEQTLQVASAIVAAYDFSGFHRVIDVGGGYGALISVVLQAYPHLEGASADLAYMEPEALAFLGGSGVAERARFIATDFFRSLPPDADCYLLKYIIHDWADADCLQILRNVRAASPCAVTLIIERIVPERIEQADVREHTSVVLGDINMMVATGGVERTEREFKELIEAAGFTLTRVIPTRSGFRILEARPGNGGLAGATASHGDLPPAAR
ncbi:MAG TPA: methyltransferase [Steroidobacteraceae bacterium]|nr:methyltransferase [Steroidobacteraceae bacterium]